MGKIKLKEEFAKSKDVLSASLRGYSLPEDSRKVQQIVSDYFSKLFENDGAYRQSLTESEDYLLMSALQIMKSQEDIIKEVSKPLDSSYNALVAPAIKQENPINPYVTLAGTGIGAIVGGLAGGTWTAIAGSIAGTALVIYYSTHRKSQALDKDRQEMSQEDVINVGRFVDIVERICESIDGVIVTYQVQVQKIKNTYERREKPSLLTEYRGLAEQVANVCNIAQTKDEAIPQKLRHAIEMMEESLENYDLKFVDGKIVSI